MTDKNKKEWKNRANKSSKRDYSFDTVSGQEVDLAYFPKTKELDYVDNIGLPGEYPYTRSIHPNLYRGRLWTISIRNK